MGKINNANIGKPPMSNSKKLNMIKESINSQMLMPIDFKLYDFSIKNTYMNVRNNENVTHDSIPILCGILMLKSKCTPQNNKEGMV
jgi:hypothetical protein